MELPGFFRPTKKWDLLVVREGQLLVALEAKSQTGPSFGNNFNNRTEEAIGTGTTLLAALQSERNSVGVEVDPVYWRHARRRLESENLNLFATTRLEFEETNGMPTGDVMLGETPTRVAAKQRRRTQSGRDAS